MLFFLINVKMNILFQIFVVLAFLENALFESGNNYEQEPFSTEATVSNKMDMIDATTIFDESTTQTASLDENISTNSKAKDLLINAEKNNSNNEFSSVINNDLFINKSNGNQSSDLKITQNIYKTEINKENFNNKSTNLNKIENDVNSKLKSEQKLDNFTILDSTGKNSGNSTTVNTNDSTDSTTEYSTSVLDSTTEYITSTLNTTTPEISSSLQNSTIKYSGSNSTSTTEIILHNRLNFTKNEDQNIESIETATEETETIIPTPNIDNDNINDKKQFFNHLLLKLLKANFTTNDSISNAHTSGTQSTRKSVSTSVTNSGTAISSEITMDTTKEHTTDSTTYSDSTISDYPTSDTTDSPGSSTSTTNESTTDTSSTNESTTDSTKDDTSSTTEPSPPNPCTGNQKVQNLNVSLSNFSIYLNWTEPLPDNDCGFFYKIKWNIISKRTVFESLVTNETEYNITDNIEACQAYNISVTVHYKNKESDPEFREITTLEAMENIQQIIPEYNEANRSIKLSWSLSPRVEKCLRTYVFQAFKNGVPNNAIDYHLNEITLRDVDSCINNTYVVFAESDSYTSDAISTTYLNPKINDPPIYNSKLTEIHDDYVITKWNFGKFVCRPEKFQVKCKTESQESISVEGQIKNGELIAKIENVEPYTNYSCCGSISNGKGESKCSEPGIFLTQSKPPDAPVNLKITQNRTYLAIKWDAPKKWNGVPENYNISIEFLQLNYELPDRCPENSFPAFSKILEVSETEFYFDTIIPASTYIVSVHAKSSGKWGTNKIEKEVALKEDIPENPRINVQVLHSTSKEYNTSLNITWETPCKMHGVLQGYVITLLNEKNDTDHLQINIFAPVEHDWHMFLDLKPDTKYIVGIRAKNKKYDGYISEKTFFTPAGIPSKPSRSKLKEPDTSVVSEPWNSAMVYLTNNIFDETFGSILYYSIIVAPTNCKEEPKYEYYNQEVWPVVSSDDSTCKDEQSAYEATHEKWNPFQTKSLFEYQYILGLDTNCTRKDCNKLLQSGTDYAVKIRGFTKNGYRDTDLLYFSTDPLSEINVGLIVGLIVGILAIAFILASVLFYTKGKINFKNWPRIQSTSSISPAPLPVPIKKFGSYYEKMIENSGKIKNEFQLLSSISSDVTLSTKTALLPINKKKNRYMNILPYDETRVLLRDINANSTDYINASYITGYSGGIEYIASQGPTEATYPAFWQMILEQNIKLVVMLTQFVEAGKDKCFKYFPDLDDTFEINDLKVTCVEEEMMNVYNKRAFKIKKGNVAKKITYIQYNLWPDFGVPDEVHHLVDFCDTMDEIKMKRPGLVLIHCSAGVGRTGTLIAMDILLQTIRDKRKVDIFGTVLNLRKQRMSMVQSERQYEFLYKCVYYVISNQIRYSSSKRNLNITESDFL